MMFRKLHLTVTQVRSGLNELNEAAIPQCSDLLDCILFTVVCFCFLLVKKRERISDELSSEPGTLLLSLTAGSFFSWLLMEAVALSPSPSLLSFLFGFSFV